MLGTIKDLAAESPDAKLFLDAILLAYRAKTDIGEGLDDKRYLLAAYELIEAGFIHIEANEAGTEFRVVVN